MAIDACGTVARRAMPRTSSSSRLSLVLLLPLLACKTLPPSPSSPATATSPAAALAPLADLSEPERWQQLAERVTITRDDWGVPHVRGATDADAVFGLMFAQGEDDFARVETNLLNALGRLAEAEGEAAIFRDLRMKLFIDPKALQAQYEGAPPWLKDLMNAWADGLNYFLHTHPLVAPRVLTRFEPWMALAFSEGSIGGDIERISVDELAAFYGAPARTASASSPGIEASPGGIDPLVEPTGSNGIAIAPSRSASGAPLLLINPHTSFFFREEAQVTSDEGLNAYGALTWGQFFVYQGWNAHAAWMHTSSTVDNIDEYRETLVRDAAGEVVATVDGASQRPVRAETITVPYRTPTGMASRAFRVFRTQHGPVVRSEPAAAASSVRWISVALMHKPVEALMQSYLRTKARSYAEFREVMELHANSSNNTVFADSSGTIAYFHANFVPRRDPSLDWTQPVDGADPRTAWRGVHSLDESPQVRDPSTGWIQNTNDWPYSSAGPDSPKAERFAAYFDAVGETPRGVAATRLLGEARAPFTLESLIAAAYDPRMPELEAQLPLLLAAWKRTPAADPMKKRTAEAIALLRAWDVRWAADSIATSLAVLWAEALWKDAVVPARAARVSGYVWMRTRLTPRQRLAALDAVLAKLTSDFGSWRQPWGALNRFQRVAAKVDPAVGPAPGASPDPAFSDAEPSLPVPFAPGRWGSLASFVVAPTSATAKKRYGISGNSFVAVVELGKDRVRARAVTAGGLHHDPSSRHFNDQAARYASGELRDVYFYPDQLAGHTERTYHPGR